MSHSPERESKCSSSSVSKRNRTLASRHYRKRTRDAPAKLGEATVAKLDAEVQAKFEAAIQTEEIKARIQERLLQERARLEKGVEEKIASERKLQLLRKRKEQEQRLKEQAELERILEENQKHLEMAKARSMAAAAATEKTATEKMQSLVQAQPTEAHLGKDVHALGDDVFVLGAGARPTGM